MPGISLILILLALLLGGLFLLPLASEDSRQLSVLRIGVLPNDNPAQLQRQFASLLEHLAATTGIETRLVVPASYKDAIRLFADREVDLAYFGGYTFVQAHTRHQAQPLVMREVDTHFVSWFLTRPEFRNLELADFHDKKIGFGSRLSTSGHLMPRHFLRQRWQIEPERHFAEILYSGALDKTLKMILDGEVDIGAVSSVIVKQMLSSGRIDQGDVHIVWETPPYPNYVWATQVDIDKDLENQLRDAFLGLEPNNAAHSRILQDLNAKWFLPSDKRDYEILAEVAGKLGLMREDSP